MRRRVFAGACLSLLAGCLDGGDDDEDELDGPNGIPPGYEDEEIYRDDGALEPGEHVSQPFETGDSIAHIFAFGNATPEPIVAAVMDETSYDAFPDNRSELEHSETNRRFLLSVNVGPEDQVFVLFNGADVTLEYEYELQVHT